MHHDLGVIISANSSWEPHLYHILGKGYKILGLLRHTLIDINCKKQLYSSFVCSQLMFASVLWEPNQAKAITTYLYS